MTIEFEDLLENLVDAIEEYKDFSELFERQQGEYISSSTINEAREKWYKKTSLLKTNFDSYIKNILKKEEKIMGNEDIRDIVNSPIELLKMANDWFKQLEEGRATISQLSLAYLKMWRSALERLNIQS